ncbi:hypothetical protein FB45DRAFT_804051 [Roridomyces roridus]|uniref:AB hydrolase-1 domain-containing protein n=1 Tax=Roridomyces roridus TaxID=1738132 RepID=A0AAD7FC04_9AGAR|nr:hypothetical protein FB45DRAFT_804051 [Roridomyces roridus]
MYLPTLAVLLSGIQTSFALACTCSSHFIPVHVDALVPKDSTDQFGGLKSNASDLRRVDEIYTIYGVFCQPNTVSPDVVQLLVHGITYTSQYWSPPTEEFRNYSYADFSCVRGLPSLAIDWLGVGLSSRPMNASDVQYPTTSAAVSQVARYLKQTPLRPGLPPFNKVIGIGHSAGSILLHFGAVLEGAESPFDGLLLTGSLIVPPNILPPPSSEFLFSARTVDPERWAALDPGYISTNNRSLFYSPDTTTFSSRMLVFDNFTKDVGSVSTYFQTPTTSLAAPYTGPVAKVVGSSDQILCAGGVAGNQCQDVEALTKAERVLWPAARSFDLVVAQGSGHDLNLDFFAQGPFETLVGFVEQFLGFDKALLFV